MYQNIPEELKALRQWICWRYESREGAKPTKVPYQALTGRLASVSDADHWCTFDEAVAAVARGGYSGIGFVFTESDPYCGIDFDASTDQVIYEAQHASYVALNSYSELSPSGKGLHVICRASVPVGLKYHSVEIYSQDRYFTFTGNVYQMHRPIAERQELVTRLWESVRAQSGRAVYNHAIEGEPFEKNSDEEVFRMCSEASNGARFLNLWNGHYEQEKDERTGYPYPSASEADFALINLIQFWTKQRFQIERLFRASALGQRPKMQTKHSNYLINRMINRAFDMEIPALDFEALKAQVAIAMAGPIPEPEPPPALVTPDNPYQLPPGGGLLAQMALFIYNAAPVAVPEAALAASIAFMAGIVGSTFHVGGAGLNVYMMLLMHSGAGKEAMASGIDRMCAALEQRKVMAINQFRGPSEIASGPALGKSFKKSAAFLSILGEFGYRLQDMSSDRATGPQLSLRRTLLDIYGKSGPGKTLGSMAYSDQKENVDVVKSPALSLLCESTPETLYNVLSERMVKDGLLPRFIVFEYTGTRSYVNELAYQHQVPEEVIAGLSALTGTVCAAMQNEYATPVVYSQEAQDEQRRFGMFCTDKYNATDRDAQRELWTRAHMKANKLAALAAVGCNPYQPQITLGQYEWAKGIVLHDVTRLLTKFAAGEVGQSTLGGEEATQRADVCRTIVHYLRSTKTELRAYRVNDEYRADKIISRSFIMQYVQKMKSFKNSRMSLAISLDRVMQVLIEMGVMAEVNTNDAEFVKRYGKTNVRAKLYATVDFELLERYSQ